MLVVGPGQETQPRYRTRRGIRYRGQLAGRPANAFPPWTAFLVTEVAVGIHILHMAMPKAWCRVYLCAQDTTATDLL